VHPLNHVVGHLGMGRVPPPGKHVGLGQHLLGQAVLGDVAVAAGDRELGQRLAGRGDHLLGRRQRHEVGLGEVAVVMRLLLRAQRGQRPVGGVEVQRLLLDLPA